MLNWIWAGFFLVAFLAGLFRWLVLGEPGVWAAMVASTFDMAKTGFEVSLGLTGVMCLWLGVMRLGEKGGAVELLARAFDPLLRRLFPGIPPGHPAGASIVMNLSANMLGLDNAATPLGLKAMKELQQLNPQPDTATNDQILFLVINASAGHRDPDRDHDLPRAARRRRPDRRVPAAADRHLLQHDGRHPGDGAGPEAAARQPGDARLARRRDPAGRPAWSATACASTRQTLERQTVAASRTC